MFNNYRIIAVILLFLSPLLVFGQWGNQASDAVIDFNNKLHEWDGFGVNYVESCQTLDYKNQPQDLGGFSILNAEQKAEILDLTFGKDGLRPEIIKMFLDPWHLSARGEKYDHEWSTKNMMYFVEQGLKISRSLGDKMQIITTLYGPPPFMTQHHHPSISIMDPEHKEDVALYMIDWTKYLRNQKGWPVNYISIHNEGTDWLRWPQYEDQQNDIQKARDYNMLWRPQAIADFMAYMKPVMDREGLQEVGLTPGEPINLFRFNHFGIADEIAANKDALNSIGLITSHGFGLGNNFGRSYANTHNFGATVLQKHRPELKTWITSMSWGKMDTYFGARMYEHIYSNFANAIIPWAFIQRYSHWYGSNHHPGLAIHVREDSTYELKKGYYLFKQFTRAGRAGMRIAKTSITRPDVYIAAFSQNGTDNPDAFVVINIGETAKYTSDLVELSFTVNGNDLYYCFPYKDLVLANKQAKPDQMNGVKVQANPTDEGYIMEFAFPWKTLGWENELGQSFTFNTEVRDGRDMPHGRIRWLGEKNHFSGEIQLAQDAKNNDQKIVIGKTKSKPVIDGKQDKPWKKLNSYTIENNQMPGTPPMISANWKMQYDEENLYVLVNVQDPTNNMGKEINMHIKGSQYKKFKAFRTDELTENCVDLGEFKSKDGIINYLSPGHSITTFIGVN